MQFLSVVLLALSTVSLGSAQNGVIGHQPLDPKLLTDLNQYVPQKRIKFKWEIKAPPKGECNCPEAICPGALNEASLNQCRFANAFACYQRSGGACPKP